MDLLSRLSAQIFPNTRAFVKYFSLKTDPVPDQNQEDVKILFSDTFSNFELFFSSTFLPENSDFTVSKDDYSKFGPYC